MQRGNIVMELDPQLENLLIRAVRMRLQADGIG